jgi:hypothetical protein
MHTQSTTPNEEWRAVPVPGYEGCFSVSNLGRVRRERDGQHTKAGRIYKPLVTPNGYCHVELSLGTVATKRRLVIHTLVALAFIGARPSPRHQVNHKNGVKTDNRADNLEWMTPAENAEHASRTGLLATGERHWLHRLPDTRPRGDAHWTRAQPNRLPRGSQHGRAKLHEDDVRAILRSDASPRVLAAQYGISTSVIDQIRARKIWRHVTL